MDQKVQSAERTELLNCPVRAIVAGSRKYNNYEEFAPLMDDYYKLLEMMHPGEKIAFITGEAEHGPDNMLKRWCDERGYKWYGFPARWEDLDAPRAVIRTRHSDGKAYNILAGYDRNNEMAEVGTNLIVFWDGHTKGSKHMHETGVEKGLHVMSVLIKLDKEPKYGGKP